jgi:cell division protein FtsQ
MSMLDRRSRKDARRNSDGDTQGETQRVPDSAGPDEETVRIAHKDFRRRRHAGKWRVVRYVLLALLLVGAVAAAVWVVFFSSYVTVRTVTVTGNPTLPESRVERAADIPMGTPLAKLNLGGIRTRVEAIPAVKNVEVARDWPHGVRVVVTERTPIAVVDQGEGLRALDAEGVLFGHYPSQPKHLPLVKTDVGTSEEALVEAGRVVGALPSKVARRVDAVQVTSVDDIQLVLGNGRRVLWGSAESSDQKAEVLAVLLKGRGQQIDVSVPGRPTTR